MRFVAGFVFYEVNSTKSDGVAIFETGIWTKSRSRSGVLILAGAQKQMPIYCSVLCSITEVWILYHIMSHCSLVEIGLGLFIVQL